MRKYNITRKNGSGDDVPVNFTVTNASGSNSYVCDLCAYSCPHTSMGATVWAEPNGLVMLDLVNHVVTHL